MSNKLKNLNYSNFDESKLIYELFINDINNDIIYEIILYINPYIFEINSKKKLNNIFIKDKNGFLNFINICINSLIYIPACFVCTKPYYCDKYHQMVATIKGMEFDICSKKCSESVNTIVDNLKTEDELIRYFINTIKHNH